MRYLWGGQISYWTIRRWVICLRARQQQLKDAARIGRPTTTQQQLKVTSKTIGNILQKYSRFTVSPVDKLVVSPSLWYFKEAFTT